MIYLDTRGISKHGRKLLYLNNCDNYDLRLEDFVSILRLFKSYFTPEERTLTII